MYYAKITPTCQVRCMGAVNFSLSSSTDLYPLAFSAKPRIGSFEVSLVTSRYRFGYTLQFFNSEITRLIFQAIFSVYFSGMKSNSLRFESEMSAPWLLK